MRLSFACYYTLLQLVAVSVGASSKLSENKNETSVLLTKTFKAITSALNYLNQQHRYVNLDTIIGTRIVEGQFSVLLNQIKQTGNSWKISQSTIREIRRLQILAGKISKRSIPYIAALTPHYYHKIGVLLTKGFWELDYESRDFSPSVMLWKYKKGEALHEEDSDNCIAEFFGTGKKTKETCAITTKCWNMMTSPKFNGYSLSHEVFYLQIGKQFGCSDQMELHRLLHNQKPIDDLNADFCANMLNEAIMIEQSVYQEGRQDLFMEQAALCGMLGYRQFFTSDWLNSILSWQDKELGCYKGNPITESQVAYRPEARHPRMKREERPLSHGCLCHRTTVALAALGQYVRYILEFIAYENGSLSK